MYLPRRVCWGHWKAGWWWQKKGWVVQKVDDDSLYGLKKEWTGFQTLKHRRAPHPSCGSWYERHTCIQTYELCALNIRSVFFPCVDMCVCMCLVIHKHMWLWRHEAYMRELPSWFLHLLLHDRVSLSSPDFCCSWSPSQVAMEIRSFPELWVSMPTWLMFILELQASVLLLTQQALWPLSCPDPGFLF